MKNLSSLISNIESVCSSSYTIAQQQVNLALTIRNWMIGAYIVEYEQKGDVKAQFGKKLLIALSAQLRKKRLKGMDERSLRSYRQFYLLYPEIRGTLSPKLNTLPAGSAIRGTVSPELKSSYIKTNPAGYFHILLEKLTYSHFLELLSVADAKARRFYETNAVNENWSVRDLHRGIETLLYQRTAASRDKKKVVRRVRQKTELSEVHFKSPYILDFLGLNEKSVYSETDLEQRIITHLQKFLVELGHGFCFEGRQKRISFDNHHYYIDLVFYHRILKCHVLIDLKIGSFDHADAGQMNLYLNYFNSEVRLPGDAPPIGLILCAGKNDALVKYTTQGLSQKVFVAKYLMNLPKEKELQKLLRQETIAFTKKSAGAKKRKTRSKKSSATISRKSYIRS